MGEFYGPSWRTFEEDSRNATIPAMSEDLIEDKPPKGDKKTHAQVHRPTHVAAKLNKQDAKDLRNNKALLYLSIFITVFSLAGFFWLAGILDWRGSEGK